MTTTYCGTFVAPTIALDIKIYRNYVLQVNDNGIITLFTPQSQEDGIKALESIASGFVLYQGTGLDLPLMQWLDRYAYKAEIRIDQDPDLASKVYKTLVRKLIKHGTGAALMFGTIKKTSNLTLAKICQDSGLRAFIGKLSMDSSTQPSYVEASALDATVSAEEFVEECNGLFTHLPAHKRLVHPVITPRFVPTCSSELLEQLGAVASKHGVMIQSHLAESKDEVAWVEKTRHLNDMQVFQQAGLLTPNTIQAHCTFLNRNSLIELRNSGTSVAHCPLSNVYFSSRPFPLREAIDLGVNVGLGTDIAGGYDIDMMAAMRMAVTVSRMRENERIESKKTSEGSLAITWKESLYLATTGGARALRLVSREHYKSPFEVGLPFDAQLITLYDETQGKGIGNIDFFDTPEEGINEELLEKWWCLGDTRNRSAMFVGGKQIL